MYKTPCQQAVLEHTTCPVATTLFMADDGFSTTPMPVVKPAYQPANEEELHTSFEQAISDRVLAVKLRLNRVSAPLKLSPSSWKEERILTTGQDAAYSALQLPSSILPKKTRWSRWHLGIMLGCLVLLLVMIGFDLMGLLVLHAR
ncbi:MAG: hypothetical protein M3Y81_14195 [Chloroflexota bacterium]|nr:hypothetical protein [Chloroflexota bacterium]